MNPPGGVDFLPPTQPPIINRANRTPERSATLISAGPIPFQQRLEGRLRRSNAVMAAILITSLVITSLAVGAGLLASRNRLRAENAEADGRQKLWHAYLAEARAARVSRSLGFRTEALAAVRSAASLRMTQEVRDEAIASEVLKDFRTESQVASISLDDSVAMFSPGLEFFVVGPDLSDLSLRRTRDGSEIASLKVTQIGKEQREQRDRRFLESLFSPDGRYFAMSFRDGSIALWRVANGQLVFQYVPQNIGELDIRFSPDGSLFGFHDLDRRRDLAVFHLSEGALDTNRWILRGKPFAFLPDPRLLTVAASNELQILDIASGEIRERISVPQEIQRIQTSLDGEKVMATGGGSDVFLWNRDVRQLFNLRNHNEPNMASEFSPDSSQLVTSSLDGLTYLWDCANGRELLRATECSGSNFSRDGRRLGCVRESRKLMIYELTESAALRTVVGHGLQDRRLFRANLSPDSRWLTAILDDALELWDLNSPGRAHVFPFRGIRAANFLPDGKTLLISQSGKPLLRMEVSALEQIESWDFGSIIGAGSKIPLPDRISARHIATCADGRTICLDGEDHRMVVMDILGERAPVFLKLVPQYSFQLSPGGDAGSGRSTLSPEGRHVVVGYGLTNHPIVFDAQTGEVEVVLPTHDGTAAFSHDGRFLLTGGGNDYCLWRVGRWEKVWQNTFEALSGQWGCMSFAWNDAWVAVIIDRYRVGILSTDSGELITTLTSPSLHPVAGIRQGHDQRRMVVTTYNNVAQVWDLAALRQSLKPLGCDLADRLPIDASPEVPHNPNRFSLATIVGSGILVSGGLGILILAVLRWHRRLAEEFVRTESQAFEQQRELELQRELNRLKSNFVSMVSHEFRTPLGVIQSSAEILEAYLDRLGPERRAEHLAEIVQSTTRMKDLMEEVLLLSRVESGRMEFRPAPVDLLVLVRRLVAEATAAAASQNGRIELVTSGVERSAKLDETLMGIVLSNLFSNALKYSPSGSPVQLLLRRDGGYLTFEVRDRGLGIPAKDQPHLFTSFHRASNVADLPGTGLGLTIVRRCVELHGGTISFASTEGQGSSFIVRLPD